MSASFSSSTTSWIASLSDPTIRSFMQGLVGSGSFTDQDALTLLQNVAAKGSVTSAEFSDLQTIAGNLNNGLSSSDDVASRFIELVDGSPANVGWNGGSTVATPLGDLQAGSSQTQLSELIGKWFKGSDLPDPTVPAQPAGDGQPAQPAYLPGYKSYSSLSLYGPTGAPVLADVAQGDDGDCVVCAMMIDMVENHPSQLASMIVNEGGGVYGVRFYLNGNATWVTVNTELPTYAGSLVYNNSYNRYSNALWADLLEKAYVEINETGLLGNQSINTYANINGNYINYALNSFTNNNNINYYASSMSNWNSYKQVIINDLAAHDDVILDSEGNSYDSAGNQMLVSDHALSVIGYDSATGDFILRNPWGYIGSNQGYDTQFEVSMADIAGVNGVIWADSSGASTLVITPTAAVTQLTTGTVVPVAPLFWTVDFGGAAISDYRLQILGTGGLQLNGASNLATTAETAAGQIVVSAADLGKITFVTGTQAGYVDLFVSANDGSGWSPATDIYEQINSASGSNSSVVPLPTTPVVVAASGSVSVSKLFSVSGGGISEYQVTLGGDGGAIALNGAAAQTSGSGSTETFTIAAKDLSLLTYTAPASGNSGSLTVAALQGSSWTAPQTLQLFIGDTAARVIQNDDNGLLSDAATLADSAANIFANLAGLQTVMSAGVLLAATTTDSVMVAEILTGSQFDLGKGVLSILAGTYSLTLDGLSAADATDMSGNVLAHLSQMTVSDGSSAISDNLDALQSLVSEGKLTGLQSTDGQTLTFSAVQASGDAALLRLIGSATPLAVSDSALDVASHLDALQSLASQGAPLTIALTDSATPTLTVNATQLTEDATALSDITSQLVVVVTAPTSGTANISGLAAHPTEMQFTGPESQYSITANSGGVVSVSTVAGGVVDHITAATALAFSDQTIILTGSSQQTDIALLYQGALDRLPDLGGLGYWEQQSLTLSAIAADFVASSEFQSKYSALSAAQFVTQLYANVLDRTPDSAGDAYWVGQLAAGASRAQVLLGFAVSAEALSNATHGYTGSSGSHAAWLLVT